MGLVTVQETAILNARPEDVYATIADYRQGHPAILPKENLYGLQVEEGGYGEGTIIRFKSRIMGAELSFYQRVTEPEPGRVLVEQDIDSVQQFSTTFTVVPVDDGQRSQVTISTRMNASSGLKGLVERMVVPSATRPVYRKELKLLEEAAQKRGVVGEVKQ